MPRARVLRAFLIAGARQEPGTELDLETKFFLEMQQTGKVELAGAFTPPSGPMTTDSVPELAPPPPGKPKKGKSNV